MATPATRTTSFFHIGCIANERWSSAVAVLPLEADEAADREPVQGVERLAFRAEHAGARREPDAELEDADAEDPGHEEVAELVDDHEGPEDEDEEGDRDRALDDCHALSYAPGPRPVPGSTAPLANAARTSRSRATSSSTSGAWPGPPP